jgi:hypothetical protein
MEGQTPSMTDFLSVQLLAAQQCAELGQALYYRFSARLSSGNWMENLENLIFLVSSLAWIW